MKTVREDPRNMDAGIERGVKKAAENNLWFAPSAPPLDILPVGLPAAPPSPSELKRQGS